MFVSPKTGAGYGPLRLNTILQISSFKIHIQISDHRWADRRPCHYPNDLFVRHYPWSFDNHHYAHKKPCSCCLSAAGQSHSVISVVCGASCFRQTAPAQYDQSSIFITVAIVSFQYTCNVHSRAYCGWNIGDSGGCEIYKTWRMVSQNWLAVVDSTWSSICPSLDHTLCLHGNCRGSHSQFGR